MRVYQNVFQNNAWREPLTAIESAQVVLLFGDKALAAAALTSNELSSKFPYAEIIGCTTAGEIHNSEVLDNSLCLSVLSFETSSTHIVSDVINHDNTQLFAENLASQIPTDGLKAVLIISDGTLFDGADLLKGITQTLPKGTLIAGGMAGDGVEFNETHVWHNTLIGSGRVVLCGFYGEDLAVHSGCEGGWSPFGPVRVITKAQGNTLFTLDDQPALDLYQTYLGKYADQLPAAGLLFPLMLNDGDGQRIRTVLNVDFEKKAMMFASSLPEGANAQLLYSSCGSLLEGAYDAAENAFKAITQPRNSGLAMIFSCLGRRLVFKSNVVEEAETIAEHPSNPFPLTGFYTYGELAPNSPDEVCSLHNQTATIFVIYEKAQ